MLSSIITISKWLIQRASLVIIQLYHKSGCFDLLLAITQWPVWLKTFINVTEVISYCFVFACSDEAGPGPVKSKYDALDFDTLLKEAQRSLHRWHALLTAQQSSLLSHLTTSAQTPPHVYIFEHWYREKNWTFLLRPECCWGLRMKPRNETTTERSVWTSNTSGLWAALAFCSKPLLFLRLVVVTSVCLLLFFFA